MHPDCDPLERIVHCTNKSPVICAIDVTGSMGEWTRIIYDKLPMFYGQIMMQGYLEDPALCFAAIDDQEHYGRGAPLQVTPFVQGAAIDDAIKKLWLVSGGGGNDKEAYGMAAYYCSRMITFADTCNKPFLFFTGDEGLYDTVKGSWIRKHVHPEAVDMSIDEIFTALRSKYHVFLLSVPYVRVHLREQIRHQWAALIGEEHILDLSEPKAVVDTMLGAIALVAGTRTMESYLADMTDRGQTEERKTQVADSLQGLTEELQRKYSSGTGNTTGASPSEQELLAAELEAARAELAALRGT